MKDNKRRSHGPRQRLLDAIGSGADAAFAGSRLKAAVCLAAITLPLTALGSGLGWKGQASLASLFLALAALSGVLFAGNVIRPFKATVSGARVQVSGVLRSYEIDLAKASYSFVWRPGRRPWRWSLGFVSFRMKDPSASPFGVVSLPPLLPVHPEQMAGALSRRIRALA